MHRNRKRRSLLALAAIGHASVLFAFPATGNAQTGPNPQNGEGYPEPRICPETQEWWSQDADLDNPRPDHVLTGRDEHTHLKVCIPAPGVPVSGTVRFDFAWQLHEMDDGYLKVIRIQSGSQTLVSRDMKAATQHCLGQTQCAGVETLNLNTDSLATGSHEIRFHAESERTDDAGALATNGWHVCVRSCSPVAQIGGRAVSPPVVEARGRWFETMIGAPNDYGYHVARLVNGFPANAQGLVPLQGTWRPHIRSLQGAAGSQAPGPVRRTFISVDPAWHAYDRPGHPNGFPGDVVLDTTGAINREVPVDTTRYSDGLHTLWVQTTGETPTGPQAAVFAIPFLVDNPGDPTPTPTPTPTATPTPTPDPDAGYDPECRPNCDQTITDLRTENAVQASQLATVTEQRDQAVAARDAAIAARDAAAAERDEALAELAAMTASRDAERERADAAEAKLDRIAAILEEPSKLERIRAIAEEPQR